MTLGLPIASIFAFLLVLARVAGVILFIPIPAFRSAPAPVRAALSIAIALTLFPAWPNLPNQIPSIGQLVAWGFAEAGLGLSIGLAVSFLLEGFQLAMQIVGLQAGYGYAMTIDPTSQSDSGVLQLVFMLTTGWLFFVFGFDREIIRILGASFEKIPAGSWVPAAGSVDGAIRLGSTMLVTGVRLALPIAALLLLIDVALALLGRMQQQLQLLSLAFPAKMLAALVLLAALSPMIPRLFETAAQRTIASIWRMLG